MQKLNIFSKTFLEELNIVLFNLRLTLFEKVLDIPIFSPTYLHKGEILKIVVLITLLSQIFSFFGTENLS